jgi:hypothetical protein
MSRRRMGASPEGASAVESSAARPAAPQCCRADRLARRCRRGSRCGDRARRSGTRHGILRDWNSSSRAGQPPLPSRIGAGSHCSCVRDFRKIYTPDLRSMRLARLGPSAWRGRSRSSGSRLAWLALCTPSECTPPSRARTSWLMICSYTIEDFRAHTAQQPESSYDSPFVRRPLPWPLGRRCHPPTPCAPQALTPGGRPASCRCSGRQGRRGKHQRFARCQ